MYGLPGGVEAAFVTGGYKHLYSSFLAAGCSANAGENVHPDHSLLLDKTCPGYRVSGSGDENFEALGNGRVLANLLYRRHDVHGVFPYLGGYHVFDFSLTEEQELLVEQVEEFMKRGNYDDYFKECDRERKYPERACRDFCEEGFHLLDCPEEYGGAGLDLVSSVLMKLKFYEYGWPALTLPGGALELDNILTYGSKEQQELIVEEVLQGRKAYTMGFTEPQAGSDNSAMATRAEHRDGKVYITGHKTFNTYATVSRYMMYVAREYEVEDKPKKDMSWYLIPLRDEAGNLTPGVTIHVLDKIGCHCMPTCEVYLDNVEVPESALVGARCNGFYQLLKNFETERLLTCVSNVGYARAAYHDAAVYASQRIQFGKTIGSFQIIQQKLVDMKIKCDNMYNMLSPRD